MKYGVLFAVLILILLPGCEYESPLIGEHTIPIDSAILGLWEPTGDEKDPLMMILRFSDTEYLIHFIGTDGMYFRGYPIKIGDTSCVQLEYIGTEDGPVETTAKKRFHVAIYQLDGNVLNVKTLNPDVIDNELQQSDKLKEAFLHHTDTQSMFKDFQTFKIHNAAN